MAFQIRADESVTHAVRRLARKQLDRIRASLEDADRHPEKLHDVRVRLKKLRSLLRLVRPELGRSQRKTTKSLRSMSHELAALRESHVVEQTAKSIAASCQPRTRAAVRSALRSAVRRWRETHSKTIRALPLSKADRDLQEAARELGRFTLERKGSRVVLDGLRTTYQRGRKSFGEARHKQSAASLHEFRKRGKDLQYQLRLVRGAAPEMIGAQVALTKRMTDLLGTVHDLAVFRDLWSKSTDQHGASKSAADAVLKIIDAEFAAKSKEALAIGRIVYSETSAAFSQRVSAYWTNWRA
jgi:CHAD domain-containing protein